MRVTRFVLLLLSAVSLFAQADRGSIAGTVTDNSGAIVPGVTLTLQNQATNLTYSATASDTGAYSFLNLPVGTYSLAATAKGFQRSQTTGIPVQVNQQARVDIRLQLGEVNQTIEVQAQTNGSNDGTYRDNESLVFSGPGSSPSGAAPAYPTSPVDFNNQGRVSFNTRSTRRRPSRSR